MDDAARKPIFKQQLHILRKPPYRRTQEDLCKLVETFHDVLFFKELEADVRTQVCRGLTLKHFPAGTAIFHEGDIGDEFYIILSGSVGILIKEALLQDAEGQAVEEEVGTFRIASSANCSGGVRFGKGKGNRRNEEVCEFVGTPDDSGSDECQSDDDGDDEDEDEEDEADSDEEQRRRLSAGTTFDLRQSLRQMKDGSAPRSAAETRKRHSTHVVRSRRGSKSTTRRGSAGDASSQRTSGLTAMASVRKGRRISASHRRGSAAPSRRDSSGSHKSRRDSVSSHKGRRDSVASHRSRRDSMSTHKNRLELVASHKGRRASDSMASHRSRRDSVASHRSRRDSVASHRSRRDSVSSHISRQGSMELAEPEMCYSSSEPWSSSSRQHSMAASRRASTRFADSDAQSSSGAQPSPSRRASMAAGRRASTRFAEPEAGSSSEGHPSPSRRGSMAAGRRASTRFTDLDGQSSSEAKASPSRRGSMAAGRRASTRFAHPEAQSSSGAQSSSSRRQSMTAGRRASTRFADPEPQSPSELSQQASKRFAEPEPQSSSDAHSPKKAAGRQSISNSRRGSAAVKLPPSSTRFADDDAQASSKGSTRFAQPDALSSGDVHHSSGRSGPKATRRASAAVAGSRRASSEAVHFEDDFSHSPSVDASRKVRNFGSLGGHKAKEVAELAQAIQHLRRTSFDGIEDTNAWFAQATLTGENRTCKPPHSEALALESAVATTAVSGAAASRRKSALTQRERIGQMKQNLEGDPHVKLEKEEPKRRSTFHRTSNVGSGVPMLEPTRPSLKLPAEGQPVASNRNGSGGVRVSQVLLPGSRRGSGGIAGCDSSACSFSPSSFGSSSDEDLENKPEGSTEKFKARSSYRASLTPQDQVIATKSLKKLRRKKSQESFSSSESEESDDETSSGSEGMHQVASTGRKGTGAGVSGIGLLTKRDSMCRVGKKMSVSNPEDDSDDSEGSQESETSRSAHVKHHRCSLSLAPGKRQSNGGRMSNAGRMPVGVQDIRDSLVQNLYADSFSKPKQRLSTGSFAPGGLPGGEVRKFVEVTILRAGASFGEVALQLDSARSATVKTREDTYCATLTRDDYTAILLSTVEKQHKDRQEFLCRLPLLEGLQPAAFNKIAAMLQPRTLQKNERVYEWDEPILQVFLAKDGEFAVCCRPHVDVPYDVIVATPVANGQSLTERGRRCSIPTMRAKTSEQSLDFMTVSLITPPCVFGLTEYLMGERKHRKRVMCRSITGTIYAILGKEIVQHISRAHRDRIQESAVTEACWYKDRVRVLQELHAPLERRNGTEFGRKRCREDDKTVHERLALARGEVVADLEAYSPEGRLRTIGKVFVRHNKSRALALKAAENDMRASSKQSESLLPGAAEDMHSSSWFMEKVVEVHPDVINPRSHLLDVKLTEKPDEPSSRVSSYAPAKVTNYNALARTAWKSEHLMRAFDSNCFHTPRLERQPRGRADGTPSALMRRAPVNLQDQVSSTAARSLRCTSKGAVSRISPWTSAEHGSPRPSAEELPQSGVADSSETDPLPHHGSVVAFRELSGDVAHDEGDVESDISSVNALPEFRQEVVHHGSVVSQPEAVTSEEDNVVRTPKFCTASFHSRGAAGELVPRIAKTALALVLPVSRRGSKESTLSELPRLGEPAILYDAPEAPPNMDDDQVSAVIGEDSALVVTPHLPDIVTEPPHAAPAGVAKATNDFAASAQSWASTGLFSSNLLDSFAELECWSSNPEASSHSHKFAFNSKISTTSLHSNLFSAHTCSTYCSTTSLHSGATGQSGKVHGPPLPPIDLALVYNKESYEIKWNTPVAPADCRGSPRRPQARQRHRLKSLGQSRALD